MKHIIGLTGLTGAGKSTVAEVFASLGATVVDCDKIAHEALFNPSVKEALVSSFGEDILTETGEIDRRGLAARAFVSPEKTAELNAATHPYILSETRRRAEKSETTAVIDAPLLFPSGLAGACDVTVAVTADRATRLARILRRDGITKEAAEARIAAQDDMEPLLGEADIELENSADVTEEELRRAAALLYRALTAD